MVLRPIALVGGFALPSFVAFFSAVLLAGVALVLPVCIVTSVIRALGATGQLPHQRIR
jgi:hypothetical protein